MLDLPGDRKKLPKVRDIHAYWSNPDRWAEHGVKMPFAYQEGCCMACGCRGGERAHIRARANGGSDDISNLHILCSECHHNSEFIEGKAYWRWIARQNMWQNPHAFWGRYGISFDKMSRLPEEQSRAVADAIKSNQRNRVSPHELIDRLDDIGIDVRLSAPPLPQPIPHDAIIRWVQQVDAMRQRWFGNRSQSA